jgi:hypothetical protein
MSTTRNFAAAVACVASLSTPLAGASVITASAMLDYAQQVAPSNATPSPATGMATVMFDTTTSTLDLTADVDGISLADITFPDGALAFSGAGPFHIHNAPAGANGPIVVAFADPSYYTEVPGGLRIELMDVAYDPALESELFAGNLYLNLHTLDYASGEIRGQISAVPAPAVLSLLGLGVFVLGMLRRTVKPGRQA